MKLISLLSKFPRPERWPSKSQWRQVFKILTKKEKVIVCVLLAFFVASALFLTLNFYFKNTEIKAAFGGSFTEGVVGSPRFINPIYGDISDTDRDLVQLIFSGLMKYSDSGEIIPDLVKEYKILEEGRVFEIYLKEDIFWQDGEKLTADDVVFTIETIQNPEYKSPLRAAWVGVDIEKISNLSLRLKLKDPSAIFLENLTVKILPRHIWQNIPPGSFPLSIYNLQPVGSGPYQLKNIRQDKVGNIQSLTLSENTKYFGEKPNIKEITFYFFNNEEELLQAAQRKEIQGFSLLDPRNYELFKKSDLEAHAFSLPRYFAIFFNPEKSEILANEKVREALNYGTNKEELVKIGLQDQGKIVNSPILPEIYGFNPPSNLYEFNKERAEDILEKAGFIKDENGKRSKIIKRDSAFQFKSELTAGSQGLEVKELQKCLSAPPAGGPDIYPEGEVNGIFDQKTKEAVIRFQKKYAKEILEPWGFKTGTGIVSKSTRKKLNSVCDLSPEKTLPLKISLTIPNQPFLVEVANLIKKQWESLGAEITIEAFDIQTLEKDIIKPRNYQALFFGEVLLALPDPLPFWHSLQVKYPGSNLSLYENKDVDKLLEEARQSLNQGVRAEKLEEFQDILISNSPAVFLYSQDYIYLASKKIKGIDGKMIVDPSKRFSNIGNWYIKTQRAWK